MWDQIEITRTMHIGEMEHSMTVRFPKPRFVDERNNEVSYWTGVIEKVLAEAKFAYENPNTPDGR